MLRHLQAHHCATMAYSTIPAFDFTRTLHVTERPGGAVARLYPGMSFHCWVLLVGGLVLLQTACGGGAQTTTSQAPPSITTVSPIPTVNGPAFTMDVYGTGFVSGAAVFLSGSNLSSNALPTTFIDSTHLTAAVQADAFTSPAGAQIFVSQPFPPSCWSSGSLSQYCGLGQFSNFINFGVDYATVTKNQDNGIGLTASILMNRSRAGAFQVSGNGAEGIWVVAVSIGGAKVFWG